MTDHDSNIVTLRHIFQPWPGAARSADVKPTLSPGALTVIAVAATTGGRIVVHRWLDPSGVPALRSWPGRELPEEPWAIWQEDGEGVLMVTVGVNRLSEDELLASASLDAEGAIRWTVEPRDNLLGVVARGLVEGIGEARRTTPTPLEDGMVGMQSVDEESPPRSWHVCGDHEILRVLEDEPLFDDEGESIRARIARVFSPASPLAGTGTLVRTNDQTRWWPAGSSPLLDPSQTPVPAHLHRIAEQL